MTKKEIRLRVSPEFHATLEAAAAARGVPLTALVSVAVYDYVGMSKPKPQPEPEPDMSVWLDDDDEPLNVGD